MPITDEKTWQISVEKNTDPYGKAVVDVARKAMELLDERPGEIDCHKIICDADKAINAGGITGFMAGCVAQTIAACHSRGDEFRRKWNIDNQISDEGEKANDSGRILNPAVLVVKD